ncbi:hypothetical protein ES703_57192 [subsurface metagenome]
MTIPSIVGSIPKSLSKPPITLTAISGKLVPIAKIVRPTIIWLICKRSAIFSSPIIMNFDPMVSPIKPIIKNIIDIKIIASL